MFVPQVSIEEELELLRRGAEDIFPVGALETKLRQARAEKRPLRVKLGIDPTATDLHLGHVIPILKLKTFQDLGHQVVLIIGDYTATIGDPTDQNKARPQLTHEQVLTNAKDYEEQVFRILDRDRTEVVFNGSWFSRLSFHEVIQLMSQMTLARMLEREDFSRRYRSQSPISLHELIYPLMQGYDSVMVRSDIELGGTDQKFNILVGRDLQRAKGIEPQVALLNPILIGLDGTEKMSKSLGNTIGLQDPPEEMYGKVMSVPDDLMWMYFELITEVPMDQVSAWKSQVTAQTINPRDIKRQLARAVVERFYDEEAAIEAARHFDRVIRQGEVPDDVPQVTIPDEELTDGRIWIVKLLVSAGLASSNGEARRLIEQGGVKIDGDVIDDHRTDWTLVPGAIVQVGKRRFAQIIAQP